MAFQKNNNQNRYNLTLEEYEEAKKWASIATKLYHDSISEKERLNINIKISQSCKNSNHNTINSNPNSQSISVKCTTTSIVYPTMGEARRKTGITKYELNKCLKFKIADKNGNYWEYFN